MNIYNNTPMTAWYGVTYGSQSDSGTIPAQDTISNPAWDKQDGLTVAFSAMEGSPPVSGNPFSVIVPQTGTGMCVTIGVYQE